MDKYYYFVTQLPFLYFEKEPLVTIQDFLEEGRKWLSSRDYNILERADINETSISACSQRAGRLLSDPQVLKDYKSFENSLRSELVQWREARKSNQEYKTRLFPVSLLKEGNPLQIEKNLMKLRWDFIEEQEPSHHFDLGFLILYYLKLQLLQRLSTFDKKNGFEKFKKYTEVEKNE
jgi:hypothetical protein